MSNPSLILPQSPAYGEDYVYAAQVNDGVVPLYNVLPLTFTRASGGTRINKDGLVQNMPYNLLEQSQTFDSSTWNKTGVTVTANTTIAPNGTTTADTLVFGASSNEIVQSVGNLVVNETYTLTIYLRVASGTATMYWGNIDYTTPSITVTTEWQRFTITQQAAATTRYPKLVSSSAVTVYAWGAQLNIGSTAQPYLATTDRLNMPRITYPVGGGCGALLLEKQSTNLFTYSEQLNNADWFTTGLTVTANQAISPDGTQNADLLDDGTASSTQHWIYQGTSFANSTTYTISFYAKYVSRKYMSVNIYNGSTSQYVDYDIQNGSVYGSTGDVTASITSVGNGWYRVVYTRTMASSGSPNFRIAMADDTGSETYTGSNKQVYLWGIQCEASSYATSYIPTTSTSATRIADACYKTGISNLIGQTEGVVYLDWKQNAFNNSQGIYANNYNLTGSISIQIATNGTLQAYVCYAGTFFSIATSANAIQIGQRYKLGFAYKSGDCALYLNGNLIGTNTTSFAFTTTLDEIDLSNRIVYFANLSEISVNEFYQYKTRLTNAELASLTTI